MQIVVCAMAKNEHKYINEWVKHYINLGFDKLYIYDNDDLDKPYIADFIDKSYLSKVVIKNIRGQHRLKLQHDIYTGFYIKYKNEFDWCLFCDIDEFLVGVDNVHTWLERPKYNGIEQIRVKWQLFGDDDLIERDMSKTVMETFVKPITSSLNRNLVDKGTLENQGKMIVRGKMNKVVIRSPHFASRQIRDNILFSVLPSGKRCFSKVVINEDYSNETIFLNHYMTKSLSEFIEQKMGRTDAVFGMNLNLDYYWRINKKTEDKLEYLKKVGITK